jgi:hypothetical protein
MDFFMGAVFIVTGVIFAAQAYYDRDWWYNTFRHGGDLTPWIRERFGKRVIRYFYLVLGIGLPIGGVLIIVLPELTSSSLILFLTMIISFVLARYLLIWIEQREAKSQQTHNE